MYQIGKAKVRIHGSVSREQLERATERFIKCVDEQRRKEIVTQTSTGEKI